MLKNVSRLESIINGKVFHLLCDQDSSLEYAREALNQFHKFIDKIEEEYKKFSEQKDKEQ